MAQPSIVTTLAELRPEEARVVTELQSIHGNDAVMKRYSVHDWLRLAWCRSLDTQKASDVLKNHKEWIEKWKMNDIPMDAVRDNFKDGFSVVAGRDFDGRPMLWQRMQFMTPADIPLAVGIKSTWFAMDAALADLESNRTGVCLIYDFSNVGLSNVSLNLFDVRDGSLACGVGHPSHVSRVLFLNPPMVFKLGFNAAKPLLPASVSSLVSMVNITAENQNTWHETLCPRTQLPEYLGGEQRGDYFTWLCDRLKGSHFLYHPDEIGAAHEGWNTPPEEATS
jgi:hypothetical protein